MEKEKLKITQKPQNMAQRKKLNKKRSKIKITICFLCVLVIAAAICLAILYFNGTLRFAKPVQSGTGKYLFTYFGGDEDEQIHLAVSEDGYHFTPLNNGESVIAQTLGTDGARDPFLIRGIDGIFYIIAADMKIKNGELSNHSLVTWSSSDLITWSDETIVEMRNFASFELCNRALAPQAIFDKSENKYMVYFTASFTAGGASEPGIYYCYTKDFVKFTAPKPLYSRSDCGVTDADISFNSRDQRYYLFYTNTDSQEIFYVTASTLTGPYSTEPVKVSRKDGEKGSSLFNINSTDKWVFFKQERSGCFNAEQTDDFINYTKLKACDFVLPDEAAQGSILSITDVEYEKLLSAYGTITEEKDRLITPFSTTSDAG